METSKIVKALATVQDPNTGQDLITANMVLHLKVEPPNVSFTLQLPKLDADYKQQLNFACQEAILAVYPQAEVHVHMANPGATASAGQGGGPQKSNPLPHVRNIIAVASGKGGVGKSTVAVNLALALQDLGAVVGLLDADVYGPSIPTMLGLQGQKPTVEKVYGKPKIKPLFAYGMPVMSTGFVVEPEQAVVLRGPRLSGIVRQFLEECVWPPMDYLIIDLPPGTGDVQLSLVQTVSVTGAVLVTTPQEVALADAIKAMNMFFLPDVQVPVLGVVENMSWFTPAELPDHKYFLFGKDGGKTLAKKSNSMLLGQIPLVQSIREGGDAGLPAYLNKEDAITREAWMKVAKNVARQTALRNELLAATPVVEVKR
ncbi:Mrp/NBP35 family ATP-binding protein [Neolewinella lacunae]|uniref:Iron-sulfur cluster carrier protein n=1 Tax=Neolewinella lacunae TaxID=1517758 RepID=A0A923T7Y5_9BACT|nr:Mrp/NBP35 family ATP-binding protein [Neolewinella lacunae]MBC6993388.1 Mrp/NBP35 family ATP-binding protein [Neolewinella lacunae]MDN3635154.1 Mrp/NBP35 family ATP-binding protein [Neolewinella lacunae]